MVRKVKWTANAVEDLELLVAYLRDEWSEESAQTFVVKLWRKIEILQHLPFIGKQSVKLPDVRRVLVTKHTSVFYFVQSDVITILDIFDNRQDPRKSIF